MKRWQLIDVVGATLAVAVLGACVGGGIETTDGDDDGSGDGGGTAEEMFAVALTRAVAECGACHVGTDLADLATGPDFLGPSGATPAVARAILLAYQSISGGPIVGDTAANSKIYFHGAHTGPAASATLASVLAAWIEAESGGAAPGPGGGGDGGAGGGGGGGGEPPAAGEPTSLVQALQQFGDCMQYGDFEATQMENVADQNTAEGQCSGCHDQGLGGAYLSADNIAFYSNQRRMPYILKFVTGTVNQDGSFRDLVLSRRYELKRDDNGHPNYLMSPERLQAIDAFYQVTYARYRAAIGSNTPCTPDDPVEL